MSFTCQSISTFRQSFEELQKKPKDNYHLCHHDICDALKDLSFDDIFNLKTCLVDKGVVRILKIRLPNKQQDLSAAAGYRLIVICNKKNSTLTLLNIFPKRGRLGQASQSPDETKAQLKILKEEAASKSLKEHDLKDGLKNIQ